MKFDTDGGLLKRCWPSEGETEAIIPESIREIGHFAFMGCTGLVRIRIPAGVEQVEMLAFMQCSALESIDVAPENPDYFSRDGVLFRKDGMVLAVYPPAKPDAEYTVPDGIRILEENAFMGCTRLVRLTIPAGVTEIRGILFRDCIHLEKFCVSPENPVYASPGGVLFRKPDAVLLRCPPQYPEPEYAIPDGTRAVAPSAFFGAAHLAAVTVPDSVNSIGNWAFQDCTALRSVTLPDGFQRLGARTFAGCKSLRAAVLPAGLRRVDERLFEHCGSLEEAVIPLNVTEIGAGAFYECGNLRAVMIPDSVSKIGHYAFYECNRLQTFTFGEERVQFFEPQNKDEITKLLINVRESLRKGEIVADLRFEVRYPVAAVLYRKFQTPAEQSYLKNGFCEALPFISRNMDAALLNDLLQIDGIIPDPALMKRALDIAIRETQSGGSAEVQMLLMRYQQEHFPSAENPLRL
ncbi:MAG: leucine-rich repeat domain-containing protein [Oscillospiraceae bacterium]|nr:leucine-rich repeat domain-containing protein [Oscillospiraceae bacterium]